MAHHPLTTAGATLRTSAWPVAGLVILLLVSLLLTSDATENSAHFGQLYSVLLVVNALGLITLCVLILWNLVGLVRQVAEQRPGARLTGKMVATFSILSVTPVVVVYVFSLQFLHRGIDSWFDVRVEQALEDALELGRAALDTQMGDRLKQVESVAAGLVGTPTESIGEKLNDAFPVSGISELTVLTSKGQTVAASADTSAFVPHRPGDTILLQLRQSGSYIGLDPIDEGLYIRAVVEIPDNTPDEQRFLQALFPVAERMSVLADSVQTAFAKYRELVYLRKPLKMTFTLTLSIVLLFSLLTALWAAFFFAHRMVAPLRDVASATMAVATGDYERQVPAGGSGELGFLVSSFNDMTRALARARDETRSIQQQVEAQRTYLEAVLARLSSGVVTTDLENRLFTYNKTASLILGVDLVRARGRTVEALILEHPYLGPLGNVISMHANDTTGDWREEVILFGPNGRRILMCRGTPLHVSTALNDDDDDDDDGVAIQRGQLIVFDDLTTLIEAQRNQAWSEVARRLAHEIKNPLTPIQLSAERLRHKYLGKMAAADSEILDRLTRTIVQQVESMKEMVNAFSSYARSPDSKPQAVDLNELINDVAELYKTGTARVEVSLADDLPRLEADPDRLRQVLHNLIKNAIEAGAAQEQTRVAIESRLIAETARSYVQVSVQDNGTGIPVDLLEKLFEPYVSTKPKGTGLGLAIVKKIVEEHGGIVWAENVAAQRTAASASGEGGVRVVMRFPTIAVDDQPSDDARYRKAAIR